MKKINVCLLLIFSFNFLATADVAPDPDEIRMTNVLVIETKEDLSNYRFFLSFYGAVHEIELNSKGKSEISSPGGGARYSKGLIIVIPKNSLKNYPQKLESPYAEPGKTLSDLISQKKIEGIIELGTHRFSGIIKRAEVGQWENPTYRIEKDSEKGFKLIQEGAIPIKISESPGIDFSPYGIAKSFTVPGYIILIGFPAAAIVILGIWLFRRKG